MLQIDVDSAERIATLTLDRPDKRNALSLELMDRLTCALEEIGRRGDAAVVILAANGSVFCSGHDFADMVERNLDGMRRLLETCRDLMLTMQRVPQPVVARVHGLATAAGCQLVAAADLAVATTDAGFVAPGGRGGWFCHTPMVAIARTVGRKRALELAFTGDPIDAQTALAWGLVNRVVSRDLLDQETERLALAASRGSRASKALGKQVLYETLELDIEAAYARAIEAMASSAFTDDGREAMRSFLEKRPGVYPPRR